MDKSAAPRPATSPRQTPAVATHPALALAVIALAQLMIVLDVTIVNVSLPHVQRALGFSGSGLEWVVTAYALTLGSLLLLGGRLGDLLGRRHVFIVGVLLFTLASLAGGFAGSPAWLVAARIAQGVGAAVIAPTALSLLLATFSEGAARNRAMGVYSAVSAAGGAVGLLLGGALVTYVNWRWVFFVNVPLGVLLALVAPRVFAASERRHGHFDLQGALTVAAGLALLVYAISKAGTDQHGVAHWHDVGTLLSFSLGVLLLLGFALIERRSREPLVPLRIFADRNRVAAYLVVFCVVTAMFGVFFFLTIFFQTVWEYSPLRSGAAYLPMALTLVPVALVSSRYLIRFGRRSVALLGSVLVVVGMLWLSRLTASGDYLGDVLGPMIVLASGLGLTLPATNLIALAHVEERDSGLASSLLNISQQIGGAIGLAVLGTVAWSAVADSLREQAAAAAHEVGAAGQSAASATARQAMMTMRDHALQVGFARGFEVAAVVAALAIVMVAVVMRATGRQPDSTSSESIEEHRSEAVLIPESSVESETGLPQASEPRPLADPESEARRPCLTDRVLRHL